MHWLSKLSLATIFISYGFPKVAIIDMPCATVLMLGIMKVRGGLLFSGVLMSAIAMVHAQHGWSSINMGDNGGQRMEFQVLIIDVSLLYVVKGDPLYEKAPNPA